jgi:hypothetical protein
VPILQQSTVDFMADPDPVVRTILSIIGRTRQAYTDSTARSEQAVRVMRDDGLVTDGKTAVLGDFDPSRVRRLITIDVPIFAGQHKPLKPGLTADDIATNEFLDPTISLPGK